jgi:hypothetical protein
MVNCLPFPLEARKRRLPLRTGLALFAQGLPTQWVDSLSYGIADVFPHTDRVHLR